ncbi:MAG: AAA-associated domain-containing protein, partial [Silvanigrellaceae bacterium]|nr:AAA-associated domain-containing protein [Silvanigrellaceae bacterium]
ESMGQSVDHVLPAIAAGEILGFITTPGILVVLTETGRMFAVEQDPQKRGEMMRNAILRLPIVGVIYNLVKKHQHEGLDAAVAIEQIVMLLPFEDHDVQFQTLLKWCRAANLLTYDSDSEKLFIPS